MARVCDVGGGEFCPQVATPKKAKTPTPKKAALAPKKSISKGQKGKKPEQNRPNNKKNKGKK